jgi:hypothetical protein
MSPLEYYECRARRLRVEVGLADHALCFRLSGLGLQVPGFSDTTEAPSSAA